MSNLLILPLVIPMTTAAVLLLLRGQLRWQRRLGVAGCGLLLAAGLALLQAVWQRGILSVQVGDWPAPYGVTFVADLFSALMVVLAGVLGLAVAVYAWFEIGEERQRFGFYPLMHVLLMGVCGAVLTGDIFDMFVWYEVMLIASFVLLALGSQRPQLAGALKYVTLNLIASAMFLAGVGMLYGAMGTLNMADLAIKLAVTRDPDITTTVALLLLVAFGIKAAIFPFFFWLPASYHTPPVVVTALFAGLLTKVGVYSLVRVFTLLFVQEPQLTHTLLLVLGGVTMLVGVLGAVAQTDVRRLLSFHIVSQIGYLLAGLGIFTHMALTGVIFFLAHIALSKSALFLVAGCAYRLRSTYALQELGGLYRQTPWLSLMFLIPALSLAGVPPLAGFFGKALLIYAGLQAEQYAIVAVAVAVSLLTLYSMIKIWTLAFWEEPPDEEPRVIEPSEAPLVDTSLTRCARYAPLAGLCALVVLLGLAAGPFYLLASRAAEQLLDRTAYIDAVMGPMP